MAQIDKPTRVRKDPAHLARNLDIVSRFTRALFEARDEQELLQSACRILAETAQLGLAWIGYCEDNADTAVRPVASAGKDVDYLQHVAHSWGPTPAGQNPVGEAVRSGRRCWVEDIGTDPIFSHGRAQALSLGYVSCVALPLVAANPGGGSLDMRGVLALYATAGHEFTESDVERYVDLASHLTSTITKLRSDLAGDVSYGVTALRARDERRRAEEALRRSEQQLRLVIDTIPTLVWSCRPDGAFDYVSRRWSEYTGISAQDALGSGWMAAYHPEDIEKHQKKRLAALASGEPVVNEVRLRRAADGQYRWHLIHGVPLRDASGKIAKWYGAASDIEDRKRAEEALRRSEAYLAEAQRLAHSGSWAIDYTNRKPIHSSDEHHRLFGFDPADGMPAWRDWMLRIHPDDRPMTVEVIERSSQEKTGFEMDYRIRHPDGTVKYLHVVGHPVLDAAGAVVEFVGTSIDMTERRRAEEDRQEAQNKLAHANRVSTMGQLVASIAHEVNQPIAAVAANAYAASRFVGAQPPQLDDTRQILDQISNDANRAGEIVGRIRSLVKGTPASKQCLNLNDAILEVVALTRSEMARNAISLRTDLADRLPSVEGDRIQLQQVVLNLILNAVEAMSAQDEGARELLIVTGGDRANGVSVTVQDSGPGLSPDSGERLFEAFYTTKSGGMGMGLAICRSIIDAHAGGISARANLPRGAVFEFTLPALRDAAS